MSTVNLVSVGMQGPAGPPGPAGAGGASARYSLAVATTGPYGGRSESGALPLVGGSSDFSGGVTANLAVPAVAYPSGLIVAGFEVTLTGIPSATDGFDFSMTMAVGSLDGTNAMSLQASGSVAANAGNGELGFSDVFVSSQVGSDLTWDPDTGVSTTAGGVYGVVATLSAGWD